MGIIRSLLPIVGAAIGYFYGGPSGGQAGWAIGSFVGNAIDPQILRGPRLGDIASQTAQEGIPRPIVFGTSPPISGNIIATSPPDERTKTERKNFLSPKVKTEHVYRTYAIRVCEGPIAGFLRIWRNGKLVYDVGENSLVSDADNREFLKKARFFLGTYSQDASPDLETLFGVGSTCAHRGTAYMVMADEELTDTGGAIPQWIFQVVQSGTLQSFGRLNISGYRPLTDEPLIDSEQDSGLRNTAVFVVVGRKTSEGGTITGLGGSIAVSGISNSSTPVCTATGHGLTTGDRIQFASGFAGWSGSFFSPLGMVMTVTVINADSFSLNRAYTGGNPVGSGSGTVRKVTSYGNALPVPQFRDVVTGSYADMTEIEDANSTAFAGGYGTECKVYYKHIPKPNHNYGELGNSIIGQIRFPDGVDGAYSIATYRNVDSQVYSRVASSIVHETELDPGLTTLNIDGPSLTVAAWETNLGTGYYSNLGVAYGSGGTPDQGQEEVYSTNAVLEPYFPLPLGDGKNGYRFGILSPSGDDFYLAAPSYGGGTLYSYTLRRIVLMPLPDLLLSIPPKVAEVAAEICQRANLSADLIDTTLLPDLDVPGIVITNAYPAAESLNAIGRVFMFDAPSYDGKMHFVPRGGDSVATVIEDEMVDDDSTIQQTQRSDSIVVPRVLNLNYYDIDNGGLSTAKQTSTRSGDRRAVGDVSLETPVVMNAQLAARTVDIQHKLMIEEAKGELKFSLPDSYIGLVIGDPLIVQWGGRSERAIIVQIDAQDGYQDYTLRRDRQSAYVSAVEGIPPPRASLPPSTVPGPTLIELLDIPLLQDADDNAGLGYCVAIAGVTAAWNGCSIEQSRDGGATYSQVATSGGGAIIGELVTELPSHPQAFPDRTNTVTVRLNSFGAVLTSSTLVGMFNRANLAIIGTELVTFAGANDLGGGLWEISYFLRGRKGTAPAAHAAGTRFVLLDHNTLDFIPASIADISKTLTLRATSDGADESSGTVVSMTYAGQMQIERQPAYLKVRRSGSDLNVSWQGVGRLGGGGAVAEGARFTGYRVEFDDGSNPIISVDTTMQALTQDVSSLSSPVTVRVFQLNSLTGEGPAAEVIVA